MTPLETWLWIAFIFACVIAVHPAIDVVANAKWRFDDKVVWIRCRNLPSWGRLQAIFRDQTEPESLHPAYLPQYRAVREAAWGSFFRGDLTLCNAIKSVNDWLEKHK